MAAKLAEKLDAYLGMIQVALMGLIWDSKTAAMLVEVLALCLVLLSVKQLDATLVDWRVSIEEVQMAAGKVALRENHKAVMKVDSLG